MFKFRKRMDDSRTALTSGAGNETRIGSTVCIEGSLSGRGRAVILGSVIGVCSLDESVVIEEGARLEGGLNSRRIHIEGSHKGEVDASDMVVIGPSARVDASIRTASLVMEDGAVVNGAIRVEPAPSGVGGMGSDGRKRRKNHSQ
ncbi:MAG: polymer-forming cytoskeletal protein [Desulfobacterales bacterium]|jgi:cytoskeletal protein CcmA (bactofilin family)